MSVQAMTVEAEVAGFREALVAAEVLFPLGVDGLYARSREFERVVQGLQSRVSEGFGDPAATQVVLPWAMPAALLATTDYIRSFPDLTGHVFSFAGDDKAHQRLLGALEAGDAAWTAELANTDVALCSAGCHPLYPLYAGRTLSEPLRLDAVGHCFRNEPSLDPARMRTFRQHEQVCLGEPDQAERHRSAWLEHAQTFFADLGLDVVREEANDPFFGRVGRVLATGQRAAGLKEELIAVVGGRPTAIASGNNHQDHFGVPFDIGTAAGAPAHSSCIGFGLERIVLALLWQHGLNVDRWPASVTSSLWP